MSVKCILQGQKSQQTELENVLTIDKGGNIVTEESMGEGPYTLEFTQEEELDIHASNENILHNWYFPDPINQKNQTEYTGAIYTIDRWHLLFVENGLQVDQTNKCIHLTGNSSVLCQRLDWTTVEDTTVTLSALYRGKIGFCYFGIPNFVYADVVNEWSIASFTYTIPAGTDLRTEYFPLLGYHAPAPTECSIRAIKLELGSVQTLAHKEGDTWVLNDPPPDKALELAKCQRYQVVYNFPGNYYSLGQVDSYGTEDNNYMALILPQALNKTPTVIYSGSFGVEDEDLITTNAIPITNFIVWRIVDNRLVIRVSIETAIPKGEKRGCVIKTYPSQFIVDANL